MESTVAVEILPSLGADERTEIGRLLATAAAADGYDALSDEARLDLGADVTHPATCLLARSGRGDLVGLATLRGGPDHWTVEVAVHPGHRDGARDGGVLAALVAGAAAEIGIHCGREVTLWLRSDDGVEEAGRLGLRPVRDLLQLRAPLPLTAASGDPELPTRAFRPGEDDAAWLVVNNRAFAGHPEQADWHPADLIRRQREPWFDPEGFLLHEDGGRLAGFCWTKVHPPAASALPALGEIYVIGVDPDFQGRGLGRALTIAGLRHLARVDIRTAMLYVEATNDPARGLYRSLGFAVHHAERAYRGPVQTGLDVL